MDLPIKETLKSLFTKGAIKTLEWMLTGGAILYFGNKIINSHDRNIINEVARVINKGDSVNQSKVFEVGLNSNYNTLLIIERLSTLEDTIYHDNKSLRKENQRLQNEKIKLLLEKSLMMFEKKKINQGEIQRLAYLSKNMDSTQLLTLQKEKNGK
jgi:hypothetical protein